MCIALQASGNTVTLLCTSKKNRFKSSRRIVSGVLIIASPDLLWGQLRQGLDLWNLLNRIRLSSNLQFDIIHAIDARPVVILPALFLKKIYTKPLVLSWWDLFGRGGTAAERSGKLYNSTVGVIETFFEENFRKYADRATVISKKLRSELINLGYDASKIKLIRVGCNLPPKQHFNRSIIRSKFSIKDSSIVCIYIGTLFKKDLELLLNALRFLKAKQIALPQTIIVGNHIVSLQDCRQLNIDIVPRIDEKEKLNELLFSADFGLLPFCVTKANQARWPSKSTDYWAFGLPVIATPVSDYEELFAKYNLGYLAKDDEPSNFAKSICEALQSNHEEIKQKKNSIQNFVESELDWKKIVFQLNSLYQELICGDHRVTAD